MKIDWNGVFPALTTKFKDNGELDLPLLQKNIEAQLEAGVKGLIFGGSLGEASTITKDEKEQLVKFAVEVVAGKVPILVNIAEGSTQNAVALAKDAKAWGANGLMLLPPQRYLSTEEETILYLKTVAETTDLPIILYNNPHDYKIEITAAIFDALVDVSTIEAVKESTRDITNVTRMKNRYGDRFKILCGVDTLTFEELVTGADGLVAGLVCALPKETVAIFNLVKSGHVEEARAIYRWFMPLLEFDINPQLVQYIKLVEVYTEIGSENVRLPRLPLSGKIREAAIATIEDRLSKRPTLPDYLSLELA